MKPTKNTVAKPTENVMKQTNDENQIQNGTTKNLSVVCTDASQKDAGQPIDQSASPSKNDSIIIISSPTEPENRKRRTTEVQSLGCSIQGNFFTLRHPNYRAKSEFNSFIHFISSYIKGEQIPDNPNDNESVLMDVVSQQNISPAKKAKRKPKKKNAEEEKTLERLLQTFQRDTVTKKGSCLIENCRSDQITWRPFNLKRHLKQMHTKEFTKLFVEEVDAEKTAEIELFNVVQDAVELVTVNGMPFSILSSSGMRGFIDARIKALRLNGYLVSINRTNIVEEIDKVSKHIENVIKVEMSRKLICLMFDIATKSTLSVIGINATYMIGWKIVCRSLGIVQVNVRHTAINLAAIIYDILAKFEVSLDRVFVVITDNAKNVVNSAAVLDLVASSRSDSDKNDNTIDFNADEGLNDYDDDDFIGEDNENELQNIMRSSELLNDIADDIVRSNDDVVLVNHVNCGTHTLQLAVNDATSDSNIGPIMNKAKEICIAMRSQIVMIEFRKIDQKKIVPPLSNDTRWNGVYIMVNEKQIY